MTTWITDAERHSHLSGQNVYVTRSIDAFLTDERLFWIVASKGMGKTLLLQYKGGKDGSGRRRYRHCHFTSPEASRLRSISLDWCFECTPIM